MGIYDLLSDIAASLGVSSVDADAPPKDDEKGEEDVKEEKDEGGEEEKEDEPAEEPEEEEEEEPVDSKPRLEEECVHSKQCQSHKHHYDECAERVTKQMEESENGKAKEDCVEEFFHLAHCAASCAAPKVFKDLK